MTETNRQDGEATGRGPDDAARNRVIEVVYTRLERIAHSRLSRDAMAQVVRTRSLVHETVLRLQAQHGVDFTDESRVLAAAANLMNQTLVDLARKHRAQKRGGGAQPVTLNAEHLIDGGAPAVDAMDFADAIERLAQVSPDGARAVQMRFWAEMTFEEIAASLDADVRQVREQFNFAKAWLRRELSAEERPA